MGQTTAEAYDDDDNNFLAHPDHPVIKGQGLNAVGRYKRVFVEHKIQRKVCFLLSGVITLVLRFYC